MSAKAILFCICFFLVGTNAPFARIQGPAGEVINRPPPPPVDEAAAARAQQAARLRRQAALADQFELALKSGNAAIERFYSQRSDGTAPLLQKALSEAEADYKRAAKLQPREWRALSGLGNVYYWERRDGASELAYKRAISLKPNLAQLHADLSRTYWDERKLPERFDALEHAAELDASMKLIWVHDTLAGWYSEANRCDKAILTYKRLLAVTPPQYKSEGEFHWWKEQQLHWHRSLGDNYVCAKRFSEAIAEYKECIRLSGDATDGCRLGHAYAGARRYAEAIDTYEGVQAGTENNACADLGLGEAYVETQDYDKAVEAFTRATKLEPDNWEGFAGLGVSYYFQKQYESSLAPLRQASLLRNEVPQPHYYYGLSQLMLGHKSEAIEQYQELKKLDAAFADKLLNEINKQ
jgi:tetratricopeptide (TPR) repeat protein